MDPQRCGPQTNLRPRASRSADPPRSRSNTVIPWDSPSFQFDDSQRCRHDFLTGQKMGCSKCKILSRTRKSDKIWYCSNLVHFWQLTKEIDPSFDQKNCNELPATNQLWDLKDLVEAGPSKEFIWTCTFWRAISDDQWSTKLLLLILFEAILSEWNLITPVFSLLKPHRKRRSTLVWLAFDVLSCTASMARKGLWIYSKPCLHDCYQCGPAGAASSYEKKSCSF